MNLITILNNEHHLKTPTLMLYMSHQKSSDTHKNQKRIQNLHQLHQENQKSRP